VVKRETLFETDFMVKSKTKEGKRKQYREEPEKREEKENTGKKCFKMYKRGRRGG